MSTPWLSVISPIYNGEKYLKHALNSIILQRDPDIEYIALDGSSTDSTLSILKSYQDKLPMKIIQQESSSSWISKTNYGLSLAAGEYVCFLHHDDVWFKNRLKTMKALAQQVPEAVLGLHPSSFIDAKGNNLGLWNCPLPAYPQTIQPELFQERLLVQNFISILSPIFKKEIALKVGGLDDSLWYTADWDFWLKIIACGTAFYHPHPLAGYRVHSGAQTVMRSSNRQNFQKQMEMVTEKHFALWNAPAAIKKRTRQISDFSIKVNVTLASTLHGVKPSVIALIIPFLRLGPYGWYIFLRDSRIVERASARLKTLLFSKP